MLRSCSYAFSGLWAQTKVIRNVSIVDVEKGIIIPQQMVVIEGEKIVRVGEEGNVKVKEGTEIIDAVAIYEIKDGLIQKVTFVRGN